MHGSKLQQRITLLVNHVTYVHIHRGRKRKRKKRERESARVWGLRPVFVLAISGYKRENPRATKGEEKQVITKLQGLKCNPNRISPAFCYPANEHWGERTESPVRHPKPTARGERNGKNGAGRPEADDGLDDWRHKWVWKTGTVGGKDTPLLSIVMNYSYLHIHLVSSNWACKRGYSTAVPLRRAKE